MPESDEPPSKEKEEAQRLFRDAMFSGSYLLTDHARQRMRQQELTTNDLLVLARTGVVLRDPERHAVTGDWTYQIESKSPDMRVVYSIEEGLRLRIRVITIIAED